MSTDVLVTSIVEYYALVINLGNKQYIHFYVVAEPHKIWRSTHIFLKNIIEV